MCENLPVDCDGGRVSALDLLASRPQPRRAHGGVAGTDGPFRRRRGLARPRADAREPVAPAAPYFLHPFYYVEYGIAQLGALQVWANSKRDKAKALADYKQGLALGGSRPLPELFSTAGCKFEFNRATIKPLVSLVRTETGEAGLIRNMSHSTARRTKMHEGSGHRRNGICGAGDCARASARGT